MRLDLIAIGLLAILAIGGVGYANYTTSNQAPIAGDQYGYSYSTPTWTPTYTWPLQVGPQPEDLQGEKLFNISYSFDEYPLHPNVETCIRIEVTSKLNETIPLSIVMVDLYWFGPLTSSSAGPNQQSVALSNLGDIAPKQTKIIVIPIRVWGNVTEGTYDGRIQIYSITELGYGVLMRGDGKDITVEVKKE